MLCGVDFLVKAAGLDLCLDDSEVDTAFRTSVMDVSAEPCPDFLRW